MSFAGRKSKSVPFFPLPFFFYQESRAPAENTRKKAACEDFHGFCEDFHVVIVRIVWYTVRVKKKAESGGDGYGAVEARNVQDQKENG